MNKMRSVFKQHQNIIFIFMLSFVLKAVLLSQAVIINRDAMVYIAAAQKFSCGMFAEGIQYYPMPLYPMLLAAFHFIVPDWILAGRLCSAIPLLLCVFPLYVLTLRLFGRGSAIAAALLFAVLPVFNAGIDEVIRDPLFLLFALGSLAAIAQFHYHPVGKTLACAVVPAVLATLVRIEGVLLLVLIPALYFGAKREKLTLRLLARAVSTFFAATFLLGGVLWAFSVLGIAGQSRLPEVFEWLKGLATLEIFSDYQNLMAELKHIEQQLPGADLRNNIIETSRHYAPLLYALGLVEILAKGVFPTSLLALWRLRFSTTAAKRPELMVPPAVVVWPWWAFVGLNLLFSMVHNFTTTRYMWLPIALSIPCVGRGIDLWRQHLTHRKVLLGLLMLVFFLTPVLKTTADIGAKDDKTCIRAAGQWLQQHDPHRNLKVLFNDRRLMLYADRVDACFYPDPAACFNAGSDCVQSMDMLVILQDPARPYSIPQGFVEKSRFGHGRTSVAVWGKGAN